MTERTDKQETVSFKEVLVATVYQAEAMMNLLERKGILTREEVMQEILEMKKKASEASSPND